MEGGAKQPVVQLPAEAVVDILHERALHVRHGESPCGRVLPAITAEKAHGHSRTIPRGIIVRMPPEARFLSGTQLLLTTLVVKLAVVATLATMLVRFRQFRRILLTEQRAWRERLVFAFSFGLPLAAGVGARLLLGYDAADFSLAGPYLAGLIAGPYAGAIVGVLVGAPALSGGEIGTLPFAVGCGFAGGGLRELCPKEEIWRLSPLFFADLPKHTWHAVSRFRIDWHVLLAAAPVGLEAIRQAIGFRFGPVGIFFHRPDTIWIAALVVLSTVLSVAIPIKIWNSARIEHRLQEQEKLLMAERVETLTRQINPHFLFNTLTSISSLIRSQPETARMLILKLSAMLRRLLRTGEHYVTLREELASVDEYLDIEAVRFGPTLAIEKVIGPDTLDIVVPAMVLQPLVENAIKHGIERKVGGGRIAIRSMRRNGHVILEVVDNGAGMVNTEVLGRSDGIGLRNVDERLRTIYGENYHLQLESTPGEGTCARMEIPELEVPREVTA
ncbi:MAG: sensor histidine kinase [Acidobacteria bacterium]|nr:sensor histidine kinase [Acidobacteriota bacterium]MYD70656.1 sensor histidine kinase [Acidobacteriota bacterium]MYJ03278.1 sensor histidine kinase [Acidobacteriota bacterium]